MDAAGLNLGLLLLRLVIGFTMLAHGYNHVFNGGKIAGTGRWFASLGMKPGVLHAWLASLTELGCGVLLIVGLLNPLAAAGVVGVMTVALLINHRPNGFFIFRPGEGYEYVLNLAVAGLALGSMGPGEWSVDHLIGFKPSGLVPFSITAIAGLGGALLLLAVFWRPEPKAVESA
jgi:putative oxidoreductase